MDLNTKALPDGLVEEAQEAWQRILDRAGEELADELAHLFGLARVQSVGWLVKDE